MFLFFSFLFFSSSPFATHQPQAMASRGERGSRVELGTGKLDPMGLVRFQISWTEGPVPGSSFLGIENRNLESEPESWTRIRNRIPKG